MPEHSGSTGEPDQHPGRVREQRRRQGARECGPRRRRHRSRRARLLESTAPVSGDRDRGSGRGRRARLRLRCRDRLLGRDRRHDHGVAGDPDRRREACAGGRSRAHDAAHELARARQSLHLRRRLGRVRPREGRDRTPGLVGDPVVEDDVEVVEQHPQQRGVHRSLRSVDAVQHRQAVSPERPSRVQGRRAARREVHHRAPRLARPHARQDRSLLAAPGEPEAQRAGRRVHPRSQGDEVEAPIILDEYGNTALGRLAARVLAPQRGSPAGTLGIMSSFGAGYSLASLLLRRT